MNNSVYRKQRAVRRSAVWLGCLLFCVIAGAPYIHAQDTGVPNGIAEQFYMQYPYATDLECAVEGNRIVVDFLMKNEKYEAFYKKNEWEYTVMDFSYDRLPEKIKEGFKRSRLGAAVVADVAVVYIPSGFETYRFLLKDTGTAKKYHYFSESGKMLHSSPYQD